MNPKRFGRPTLNRQCRPPEYFFRLYIPQPRTCLFPPIEARPLGPKGRLPEQEVFRIPVRVPYIIYYSASISQEFRPVISAMTSIAIPLAFMREAIPLRFPLLYAL